MSNTGETNGFGFLGIVIYNVTFQHFMLGTTEPARVVTCWPTICQSSGLLHYHGFLTELFPNRSEMMHFSGGRPFPKKNLPCNLANFHPNREFNNHLSM